jgi:proline racemase
MAHQRDWMKRNADTLRRAVVLPPRGHADLTAAVLTEPVSPQAHAGFLLMDATGYPSMSGHGIIAATTIAIERSLIFSRDFDHSEAPMVLDTQAGLVRARATLIGHGETRRVEPSTRSWTPRRRACL